MTTDRIQIPSRAGGGADCPSCGSSAVRLDPADSIALDTGRDPLTASVPMICVQCGSIYTVEMAAVGVTVTGDRLTRADLDDYVGFKTSEIFQRVD
jgi:hypothetical protein